MGCVLLLTGQVALGLGSVVSDMAVPTSLWGSAVGCVLLTVACHKTNRMCFSFSACMQYLKHRTQQYDYFYISIDSVYFVDF